MQRYAEVFYDNSLSLVYQHLDPEAEYALEVMFHGALPARPSQPQQRQHGQHGQHGQQGRQRQQRQQGQQGRGNTGPGVTAAEGASSQSRLTANGVVLQDYQPPPAVMELQRFRIPANLTATGTLTVRCSQPPGLGGTGRTCQISEAWLRQL